MADINVITVSGRAGGDPEVKQVGDNELATFSLAVNKWSGKDKGEEAMWLTVNIWGKRAKVAQYIRKGMKLMVTGRLDINVVGEGDSRRWYTSVNASDVVLPDKGDDSPKSSGGSATTRSSSRGSKKPF